MLNSAHAVARKARPRGVLLLSQTYPPDVGGVETHLADLTAVLARRSDIRTWVLCYQPIVTKGVHAAARERTGSVSVRRYWWFGGNLFRRLEAWPALLFLYITPYFLLRALLFMLAHARRVDVIHAHGFNMGFVGYVLGVLFGKRVVFQSHALYSFRKGALFTRVAARVLRRADRVLALCRASRDEIVGLGVAEEAVAVYRYWIDLDRFCDTGREASRARLGWGSGRVALFVGRLIGIKGEGVVARLAEAFPDVTFVIAGDGPNRHTVKAAARRLPNLRFIGLIVNDALPDYYRAADLLLVPSQYPEGFGRVICEGLACGTPVIASNLGGIPDAMDETVGILCEPTFEAFAAALRSLCGDAGAYARLRAVTRPYACARFSERNAETILDALLSRRGGGLSRESRESA